MGGRTASAFSLSQGGTHASGPNDPGRSAHNVSLGTVHGGARQYPAASAYPADAISGAISAPCREQKADGVLRTTEVYVHSMPAGMDLDAQPGMSRKIYNDMQRDRLASHARVWSPSRSSSEVEFAVEGARPPS